MKRTTRPIGDLHADIARLTDEMLLDWLQNGREVPQVIENQIVMVKRGLTAAESKVILERMRQLGLQSPALPGTAAGGLLEAARLKFNGRALPPPSEDVDAATGT